MNKFRCFLNISKEEKWLNTMAKQGWQLTQIGSSGYTFRRAAPEDENIRIDYRSFKSKSDRADYLALFEDSGWQYLTSSKITRCHYFKRVNADHDDIFSDTASKAARYRRLSHMYLFLMVFFIALTSPFVVIMLNGDTVTSYAQIGVDFSYFDPKTWYLTPGLWERSGMAFWFAFLFETPFALTRACSWIWPLLCVLIYLFCAIKSQLLYRQTLRQELP